MKRKADQLSDALEHTSTEIATKEHTESTVSSLLTSFTALNLDSRIAQAIGQLKYVQPTLVQAKVIPLALEGKDVFVRAKTGSGKTAAYLIPILQKLLERKQSSPEEQATSVLILVPTKDLSDQVQKTVEKLITFSAKSVRSINIAPNLSDQVQQSLLSTYPDIVISTPSRVTPHLNTSIFRPSTLQYLVVDEADRIFSYDQGDDLRAIAKALPSGLQTFLMSATLSADVDQFKGLFCRDIVSLELDTKDADESGGVSQFCVSCGEDEKFLLVYVIFKLKLIKGKCLLFVSDIDRCYRLKLYLEQFAIRSCILNSELPLNSRLHVVEEFNRNVYDIIIATDENEALGEEDEQIEGSKATTTGEKDDTNTSSETKPKKKSKKTRKRDKEYGVSRGIDFQNVSCVINFDLPTTSRSYTHRIGRTARAGKTGMALSFAVPLVLYGKHRPTSIPSAERDDIVLEKIKKRQAKLGQEIKPFAFNMKQVEAFKYRMDDALRAVTKVAIKEARIREVRQELLTSEKLKRHFEENPIDLQHLRHDNESRAARTQSHLKHVPEYLLPDGTNAVVQNKQPNFVGFKKGGPGNRIRKARAINKMKSRRGGKKADPLKSFSSNKRK